MGKFKLRIVAFIDLYYLKYPGVANLTFIYSICDCHLVILTKFMSEIRLVVYMQIFLLRGIFVTGNEWQNFLKMCNHTPVRASCLKATRYEQKPCQEFLRSH